MKIARFEDLAIWKESLAATKRVYALTMLPSFYRDFALRDQMRRAVVSISSNIAEGFEKHNNNELIRYLRIAKGSAGEVRSQLCVAEAVGYLSRDQFLDLQPCLVSLSKQIAGFIFYLMKRRNEGHFIRRRSSF
ncbi:MAG: four helix bundle protein [Parcubacteria group bacterium]|nr:four helix bundle protein [Parcubacteria group bacterium]